MYPKTDMQLTRLIGGCQRSIPLHLRGIFGRPRGTASKGGILLQGTSQLDARDTRWAFPLLNFVNCTPGQISNRNRCVP
jgi:hypothetical protein